MTAAVHADTGERVEVGPAHEAADLFPLMEGDEFDDLVADIADNGLKNPVVLLPDGRLLDGRNRVAACDKSGTPVVATTYHGDDPTGYVLSLNVHRRHLTASQRAMIAAKARLLGKQSVRDTAASAGVAASEISKSSTVIDHAPELADDVRLGRTPLNDAYKVAKHRKDQKRTREEQERRNAERLTKLRDAYPDLADKVDAGEYTLPAAEGEARERIEQRKSELDSCHRQLVGTVTSFDHRSVDPHRFAEGFIAVLDRMDRDAVRRAAHVLSIVAEEA